MKIVKITGKVEEAEDLISLKFRWGTDIRPGQFFMVWVPGIEEKPMSASYISEEAGITVEKKGSTTSRLHQLAVDDKLGIRGPFGNGFAITGEKTLVVGGGTGTAPLGPLVEQCEKQGKTVIAAIGAKSSRELFFIRRLEDTGTKVFLATDDGSEGHHGFVSEVAETLLKDQKFDQMIACGPEPMMVKLVELAGQHNVPIQCSLERYMKCGFGICDSCSFDGLQVCKDGPVFDGQLLRNSEEFGNFKRAKSGLKIGL